MNDNEDKIKIELSFIEKNDIELRRFKSWFKCIKYVKLEDLDGFCRELMFVNAYKTFIGSVNEICIRDIEYTINGERYDPNKSLKLDDAQYMKFKDNTLTTFDTIVIVAENELGFKSCDYNEVVGFILDNVLEHIKDNDSIDLVLERCSKICPNGLEDWFEQIEEVLGTL